MFNAAAHHKKRQGANWTVGQKLDAAEIATDVAIRGFKPQSFFENIGSSFSYPALGLLSADLAFSGVKAPRGQLGTNLASAGAAQAAGHFGFAAGSSLGSVLGAATLPFFGEIVGYWLGGTVGALASDRIARTGVARAFRRVYAATDGRVNFGGNYKDSQVAYTMRQRAEQELSGSLLNSRRYLGKEAQLMHS